MGKAVDGGPAFPNGDNEMGADGMSLRDYFAAKAMQDVMQSWRETRKQDGVDFEFYASLMASDCYIMADAMLRARKEKESRALFRYSVAAFPSATTSWRGR